MFDGVPALVADYMWDLIAEQIPADADASRIQGFIEGYTEAFTSTLKTKLEGIEDNATADQSDTEILNLLLGLGVNDRGRLRQAISAQVAGNYAPGSTISATVANVLAALQGLSSDQEGQARLAIQALGRDVTTLFRDRNAITAHIYIVTDANGVVAIGSGSYTLQSGQKAVGIDFAGGVT